MNRFRLVLPPLGSSFALDSGLGRRCSCCGHRRGESCGGSCCACRVRAVEAENLALREGGEWPYWNQFSA